MIQQPQAGTPASFTAPFTPPQAGRKWENLPIFVFIISEIPEKVKIGSEGGQSWIWRLSRFSRFIQVEAWDNGGVGVFSVGAALVGDLRNRIDNREDFLCWAFGRRKAYIYISVINMKYGNVFCCFQELWEVLETADRFLCLIVHNENSKTGAKRVRACLKNRNDWAKSTK